MDRRPLPVRAQARPELRATPRGPRAAPDRREDARPSAPSRSPRTPATSTRRRALAEAMSALDRAAKSGAIHANAAARRKSRLALKVNDLLAGTAVVARGKAKNVGKAAGAEGRPRRASPPARPARRRAPRPPPARPAPRSARPPAPRPRPPRPRRRPPSAPSRPRRRPPRPSPPRSRRPRSRRPPPRRRPRRRRPPRSSARPPRRPRDDEERRRSRGSRRRLDFSRELRLDAPTRTHTGRLKRRRGFRRRFGNGLQQTAGQGVISIESMIACSSARRCAEVPA